MFSGGLICVGKNAIGGLDVLMRVLLHSTDLLPYIPTISVPFRFFQPGNVLQSVLLRSMP
jgi:hypothetical protein